MPASPHETIESELPDWCHGDPQPRAYRWANLHGGPWAIWPAAHRPARNEWAAMQIGYRFGRTVRWSRDDIKAFATLVGDRNPLHHDEAQAAASRFGGLIASGAQTVAYLMAVCASESSEETPGVGLEFNYRLVGPARPDDEISLSWEVVASAHSDRPRGTIVELRGAATGSDGRDIVTATARTLLFDPISP